MTHTSEHYEVKSGKRLHKSEKIWFGYPYLLDQMSNVNCYMPLKLAHSVLSQHVLCYRCTNI